MGSIKKQLQIGVFHIAFAKFLIFNIRKIDYLCMFVIKIANFYNHKIKNHV